MRGCGNGLRGSNRCGTEGRHRKARISQEIPTRLTDLIRKFG
jgi:hypothetical protein